MMFRSDFQESLDVRSLTLLKSLVDYPKFSGDFVYSFPNRHELVFDNEQEVIFYLDKLDALGFISIKKGFSLEGFKFEDIENIEVMQKARIYLQHECS